MSSKEPVLLTVLIQTEPRRWFVGGIDFNGRSLPLLRSVMGDFDEYQGLPFDEQVGFLRHRFASVLQQGCDRLWHHQKKPACIVFVADGPFESTQPDLSQRVAEHFVTWMTNPPVAFLSSTDGSLGHALQILAGELTQQQQDIFDLGLPEMVAQIVIEELWEESRRRMP
jgi:hypothetical protein